MKSIINAYTIEHRDDEGNLKYIEKGDGLAYQEAGIWKHAKTGFKTIEDPTIAFEQDEAYAPVKIGKQLQGTIEYTLDGITYKSSVLGVGYCDSEGNYELFDIPNTTAPELVDENVVFDALQYGRIEYEQKFGTFIQRLVIPDKSLLPSASGLEYICLVTEFDTVPPNIREGQHELIDGTHDYTIIAKIVGNKLIEMINLSDIETDDIVINYVTKSGSLSGAETWLTGNTYYLSANVTVDSGDSLTVQPGVIIKGALSATIRIEHSTGWINLNGTEESPIYFTSKNDNTVGEIIAGSSGSPVLGDFNGIYLANSNSDYIADFVIFRYGHASWGIGRVHSSFNGNIYIRHCHISQSGIGCYLGAFDTTYNIENTVFTNNVTAPVDGISVTTTATINIKNCIFWQTNASVDVNIDGALGNITANIKNCLFKRGSAGTRAIAIKQNVLANIEYCTIDGAYSDAGILMYCPTGTTTTIISKNNIIANGVRGFYIFSAVGTETWTSDYNNCYNNSTSNFDTVVKGGDDLETNPQWSVKGSGDYDGYYLNQATSPCFDSGSESAVDAELGYGYGTDPSEIIMDADQVDRGWHYQYVYAPFAGFSGTPTSLERGNDVTFTDASYNYPLAWDWDFGDGSAHSTDQNPTHTYQKAGTYTVILTASNGGGESEEEKIDYIVATDYSTTRFEGHYDFRDKDGNIKSKLDEDGNFTIIGELKIKVYEAGTEPILDEDDKIAIWKDTSVSGSPDVYLVFRRGSGDQVKVALS